MVSSHIISCTWRKGIKRCPPKIRRGLGRGLVLALASTRLDSKIVWGVPGSACEHLVGSASTSETKHPTSKVTGLEYFNARVVPFDHRPPIWTHKVQVLLREEMEISGPWTHSWGLLGTKTTMRVCKLDIMALMHQNFNGGRPGRHLLCVHAVLFFWPRSRFPPDIPMDERELHQSTGTWP